MLGSGALVVMAEGTDLLAAATNVLRFFRDESCGKCVPCRVGSTKAHTLLAQALAAGDGVDDACGRGCSTSRWCCAGPPSAGSARWPSARSSACWAPSAVRAGAPPAARLRGDRLPGHEFFTTLTVAQALHGFRPARRTAAETVALADALHRVPAEAVTATSALPGFARATVDGFAVRAADTYGVSDGQPGYLDVTGAVAMGRAPTVAVVPGTAVAVPTGGALPQGADAVVMVEHTQEAMPGTIEVVHAVAPGDGMVRADEDAAPGALLAPAGRPLRPHDLGLLAAAGVTGVSVWARPVVGILSTGDEVVPPGTATLLPGQVRDATASALAGLVTEHGGTPQIRGIVPDDAPALDAALREAVATCDLVVVSAGSSVGARDETASAWSAASGPPGIFCHGLAIRPGKPTLLAECGGVPRDRAAGAPAVGPGGLPARGPAGAAPARRVRRTAAGAACPGPPLAAGRVGRRAARRRAGAPARGRPSTPSRSSATRRCCPCWPRRTATWSCPRPPRASPPEPR